jgi:xanthine/uracil permease
MKTLKTYLLNRIHVVKWKIVQNWKKWLIWLIGYPLILAVGFALLGIFLYALFHVFSDRPDILCIIAMVIFYGGVIYVIVSFLLFLKRIYKSYRSRRYGYNR